MKVLFASLHSPFHELGSRFYGGAERSLRLIGKELAHRGHDVHYLTSGKESNDPEMVDGIKVHGFKQHYLPLLHKGLPPLSKLNRAIISHHNRKVLRKIIRENGIEIVHFYDPLSIGGDLIRVCSELNVPMVMRIGGKPWEKDLEKEGISHDELFLRMKKIDHFISNCRYLGGLFKEIYREKTGFEPSISVFDIGMDMKIEEFDPGEKNLIISIATFKEYQKRQDILIRAVGRIKEKGREIRLVLIGDGPNLDKMKDLARELSLEKEVEFLGRRDHKVKFDNLNRASVLVHAAEYEGVSKTLIEAMALSKPMIASDVGGIREYIIDGKTGILARNDPEDFAEKICSLLDDGSLQKELGENAKRFFEDHCDPRKNIERYERTFSEIIGGKGKYVE